MIQLPAQRVSVTSSDPWWKLRAGWIYSSITAGELRDHDAREETLYPVQLEAIGRLTLPGGRLVAADPYVMEDAPKPFEQVLDAEAAEVIAARAIVGEGHDRVAALLLRVGAELICDWVMATVADQDVTTLDAEGFFGYGVDAGTGAFGSPNAMRVAGRVLQADAGMLEDPVSMALLDDGIGTRSAVLIAPEAGATEVAVCSSGWGDGSYPTWLGIDTAGAVVVAVTDFLLTGDPHTASPPERLDKEPVEPRPKSLLRRWFGAR